MEWIDPKRLTIGCVVRPVYKNGFLPCFSDSVVLGIYVSYSKFRTIKKDKEKEYFLTLSEAQAAADPEDWVVVILGRPMLYADNEFICIPSWSLKCEVYEVVCPQIVDGYKVVVTGNGEYEIRNVKPPIHTWQVLFNGKKVYDDLSEDGAKACFKVYQQIAQGTYGCKPGGKVTLMRDGVVDEEYVG